MWHYALLALLPLLLLAVNRSWLASSLFLDPYIYLGYYLDLPGHLQALPDNYTTTRLPVLLPGWLAHACLPVLAANAVLHLGLYYVCIFCLYRIVTGVAGRRPALLACILLGANSFFQSAVGTDYTDGYAIAFILIGLDFLQSAARAARPSLPRWFTATCSSASLPVWPDSYSSMPIEGAAVTPLPPSAVGWCSASSC